MFSRIYFFLIIAARDTQSITGIIDNRFHYDIYETDMYYIELIVKLTPRNDINLCYLETQRDKFTSSWSTRIFTLHLARHFLRNFHHLSRVSISSFHVINTRALYRPFPRDATFINRLVKLLPNLHTPVYLGYRLCYTLRARESRRKRQGIAIGKAGKISPIYAFPGSFTRLSKAALFLSALGPPKKISRQGARALMRPWGYRKSPGVARKRRRNGPFMENPVQRRR